MESIQAKAEAGEVLAGARVLIVEDDFLIAIDLETIC